MTNFVLQDINTQSSRLLHVYIVMHIDNFKLDKYIIY